MHSCKHKQVRRLSSKKYVSPKHIHVMPERENCISDQKYVISSTEIRQFQRYACHLQTDILISKSYHLPTREISKQKHATSQPGTCHIQTKTCNARTGNNSISQQKRLLSKRKHAMAKENLVLNISMSFPNRRVGFPNRNM